MIRSNSDAIRRKGSARTFCPPSALLAGLLCLALTGCGGGPVQTFDLSAVTSASSAHAARAQLVVSQPVASSPIDSDRIVVRPTPDTVATLKGGQWSEPLPLLVQTKLVQSFENGRFLLGVGRSGSGIVAQYSLSCEIRRFEIDVATGTAVVEMSVKLVSEGSGRIVAAQIFSSNAPVSAADAASAAPALDAVLGKVMSDIVAWTAARV